MTGVGGAWKTAWRTPGFPLRALLSLAALVAALAVQVRFYSWNEGRSGAVLDDPLLELFAPRDCSTLAFGVIYAALLATLVALIRRPGRLILLFQCYALTAFVRMGMMYCVPLDPPPRIIPLRDPLVEVVGSGDTLTRDLFFSGHTATLFLLFLVLPRSWLRPVMLVACGAVAAFTVWQHSHYVIDVLVAPFVAYGCWRIVKACFTPRTSAPS